jgi:predicted molibdopterin-dependent oxidoreductase YjgC
LPDTFNDAATSKDEPAPGLTISVQPEQRLFEANQKVLLVPRRGQVTATACITNTVQAGQVFVPMHYSVANDLAFPAFDPYSRQPAYKACAVSVTPL